jgi:hypothetical protein
MFRPLFSLLRTISVFAVAAALAFGADQPPAPQDSKKAVPSTGKEAAGKPASPQSAPATSQQAAPAGGIVVFVDPSTGKIRQPDASEIGGLVTSTAGPAPKAPEPNLMQGPGGAVGARLGAETLTYMVVTTTPDGKLAMDCVTGEKAAAARVTAPQASQPKEASAGETQARMPVPQDTQHHPQDTQNVKIQR